MPTSTPALNPEALRDVLGLARLLHALEQRNAAGSQRLARIVEAGRLLAIALRFARDEADKTPRAAPERAREGLNALAAVGWPEPVAKLVEVAARRVA